jgi:hypothetical protein
MMRRRWRSRRTVLDGDGEKKEEGNHAFALANDVNVCQHQQRGGREGGRGEGRRKRRKTTARSRRKRQMKTMTSCWQ